MKAVVATQALQALATSLPAVRCGRPREMLASWLRAGLDSIL